MKINRDTNIIEALEANPHAAEILMSRGVGCIGCAAARFETLGEGLEMHGFNKKEIDEIIKELNKK